MPIKETLQQKVWDYIRRNPNFRAGDILMLIPISKVGLTRYLVALTKAEYLQQKARETRPKHFEDNEYTLIKKVGVCAPKYNETALFDPNTKTTYPITDGEIKSVREGEYAYYASLIGRSAKFLNNYRGFNQHLTSAEECYKDYLSKKEKHTALTDKVQRICSFLKEKKKVLNFGQHLCGQGLYTKRNSFLTLTKRIQTDRQTLLNERTLKSYKVIVKEFEALYGAIDTLKETL